LKKEVPKRRFFSIYLFLTVHKRTDVDVVGELFLIAKKACQSARISDSMA